MANRKLKIIYFILVLGLYACNPFATRKAEEPVEERSSREIPSDPEAVLRNLQNAISEKNVTNYMSCLTDSAQKFRFIPEQSVKENNPGLFENWDLQKERNYINQLFTYLPADSVRKLSFEYISNTVFPDSVLVKRKYLLEVRHTLKDRVPQRVIGQADFWMFQDDGYWYIYRWEDIRTTEQPSWSSIKAGFGK